MSISPEALQVLDRMLEANQEYVGQLSGSVPRTAQELATLAADYSMYMLRAGLTSDRLAALDAQLQGVSASLHRAQFDLEQQLRDDIYALRLLQDVVLSAAQESAPMENAVRIAINPLVSILGMSLPAILGGDAIVSVVLGLPTIGPLLLEALLNEDVYLAGTLIMMYSLLLIAGNLLADIALAWVDPRIRYD